MAQAQTFDQRRRAGSALRRQVPRSSHAIWDPPARRPDPVAQLAQHDHPRLPDLIPVRYGRMLVSPFTFLRGSAVIMANDLARTPRTGLVVQACGDAHLGNFGVSGTPERNLAFDVNDFDETLPLRGSGMSSGLPPALSWLRRTSASPCRRLPGWPVVP